MEILSLSNDRHGHYCQLNFHLLISKYFLFVFFVIKIAKFANQEKNSSYQANFLNFKGTDFLFTIHFENLENTRQLSEKARYFLIIIIKKKKIIVALIIKIRVVMMIIMVI